MELLKLDNVVKNMSKKDLNMIGSEMARITLEEGNSSGVEMLLTAKKGIEILTGVVGAMDSQVRSELTEAGGSLKSWNSELTIGSTGDRLDYEKDAEYMRRKQSLKDREAILKLAMTSGETVIDSDGIEVPIVGIKTFSKETLKCKL